MSAERRALKDETIIDNEYCLLLIMVLVKVYENESGNLYFRPKRQERRILGIILFEHDWNACVLKNFDVCARVSSGRLKLNKFRENEPSRGHKIFSKDDPSWGHKNNENSLFKAQTS